MTPSNEHNNAPAVPQGLPAFDDLDDDVIDAACTAGSLLYRVDLMRAYECIRKALATTPAPAPAQGEPFGHFRAEPFGWTDCAEDDEGAIALYERPAAPAVPQGKQATIAGLDAANGHLSTLLDGSVLMLKQLRQMVDDLHERWSNGGKPERGEFDLLDRVDDWLSCRPDSMLYATPSQPADGRGTDAQIKKEREIARHAIVGALAAGYSGQAHPGADHWLAAAHDAGAQIKALEASSAPSQEPVTLTDEWAECKRISELPEVDKALLLFAEGETTEDQAVAIVQAIIAALREKQAKATP